MSLFGSNLRYERWRWQIFGITWLAYAGFYLTRKSFSVAKIELGNQDVTGWTKADMAWVDFGYLVAYAAGQFFWGVAGDRAGTRKVILIGMFASVMTAAAMGASTLIVVIGILACIQGICQSSGWAPLAKNLGSFFSLRERGCVIGFWCTSYALGGFLASALAGWAADSFGWRYAFWVPAATLLVVWVLFVLLQRNRPEDVGLPPIEQYHSEGTPVLKNEDTPGDDTKASWKIILAVVKNPTMILLAAVYFFLKPTRYLVLFWSPVYVNERLGAGAAESGILGSMFDVAGPAGVLIGGYLSDKVFGSRRMPMSVIGLFLLVPVLYFFQYLPDSRWALGLGFAAIGFLLYIPDSLVSGTAAIDFGTKKGASTAAGLINGFGSIGAVVGGTLPGWMESLLGDNADTWSLIFRGLAVSILIAGVLLLPKWNAMPPTAHREKEGSTDEQSA